MLKDIKDLDRVTKEKMGQPIAFLQKELSSIRTGRATPAILDGVQVDYFGTPTPISQLASVSAPESRLIVVQPWDPTVLGEMEKAILRANLGLTPTNDGKVIRIAIPALTEERRKELVKVARKMAEEAKVALRNVRRELKEQIKDLEKKKEISEDQMHTTQGEVQKLTDKFVEEVDGIIQKKEKEILEI
jgi:ribosome recycling factor